MAEIEICRTWISYYLLSLDLQSSVTVCMCVCLLVIVKRRQTHDPWSRQGLMTTTGESQWPYKLYIPRPRQQGTAFEPRAPLVVWAGMVFRQVWLHQWCDSPHLGGERYKTLQGLPSMSRGKWNMENVTGILWHFTPWAFLKRVKWPAEKRKRQQWTRIGCMMWHVTPL